jgi:hypothetical protein
MLPWARISFLRIARRAIFLAVHYDGNDTAVLALNRE